MRRFIIGMAIAMLTILTMSCNNFADVPQGKYCSIHEDGVMYTFTRNSDSLYIDCKDSGCGLVDYKITLLVRDRTNLDKVDYYFKGGESMSVRKLDRERYEVKWRGYPTDTISKVIE